MYTHVVDPPWSACQVITVGTYNNSTYVCTNTGILEETLPGNNAKWLVQVRVPFSSHDVVQMKMGVVGISWWFPVLHAPVHMYVHTIT